MHQKSGTTVLILGLFLMQGCAAQRAAPVSTRPGIFSPAPRVARIWHGRVPAARADEYSTYLYEAGVKKFHTIPGNRGVQMVRRDDAVESEFYVISYWDSRDAIRAYAGADIEKTRHLPRDAEFLIEPEPNVRHFDIVAAEPPDK